MGYGTGRAYTRTPDGNLSRDHAARKKSVNPVFDTLDEKWAAYLRALTKEIFESGEALNNQPEKAVCEKPFFLDYEITRRTAPTCNAFI
jgi:hypothetical protein